MKIRHFVFFILIDNLFWLEKDAVILINSSKFFSLSARSIISSAQKIELSPMSPTDKLLLPKSFNSLASCDRNMLKSRGLRIHPCLTPLVVVKQSVHLLFILIHAWSLE